MRLVRSLLPFEFVALLGITANLVMSIYFDLPFLKLSIEQALAFGVVFTPFIFYVAFAHTASTDSILRNPLTILRLLIALYLCSYCVFNTKAWSHLLHTDYFDTYYQDMDLWLAPLIQFETALSNALQIPINATLYGMLFVLMIMITIPACFSSGATNFFSCGTAYCLNLIIGGLLYCIAPALGPFIFWPTQQWQHTHTALMQGTANFITSTREHAPFTDFSHILGAMPSLHLSVAVTLTYYLFKKNTPAGVAGLLATLYFFIHAKLTGLHYYIDLLIGLLLAYISIKIANKLTLITLTTRSNSTQTKLN